MIEDNTVYFGESIDPVKVILSHGFTATPREIPEAVREILRQPITLNDLLDESEAKAFDAEDLSRIARGMDTMATAIQNATSAEIPATLFARAVAVCEYLDKGNQNCYGEWLR